MKCVLCKAPCNGGIFCGPCGKSYDRAMEKDDGTIRATIEWTARRVRRLDAKRRTDSATTKDGGR